MVVVFFVAASLVPGLGRLATFNESEDVDEVRLNLAPVLVEASTWLAGAFDDSMRRDLFSWWSVDELNWCL